MSNKFTPAEKACEQLQTAFCNAKRGEFFNVSHILGADWNYFNGFRDIEDYKQKVKQVAEMRFGKLPYDPFSD